MSGLPALPHSLQQVVAELYQEKAKQEAAERILTFSHAGLRLSINMNDPEKRYINQVPDFLRKHGKKAVPVLKLFAEQIIARPYPGGPVFFGAYLQGLFEFESPAEAISVCEQYQKHPYMGPHAQIYKIKFLYLMGEKHKALNLYAGLELHIKAGFSLKWQGWFQQLKEAIAAMPPSILARSPVRSSVKSPVRRPGKRAYDDSPKTVSADLEEGEVPECFPRTPQGAEPIFSIPAAIPAAIPEVVPEVVPVAVSVAVPVINADASPHRKVRVMGVETSTQTEGPNIHAAESGTQTEDLSARVVTQDQATQVLFPRVTAGELDLSLASSEGLAPTAVFIQPEPRPDTRPEPSMPVNNPAFSLAPIVTNISVQSGLPSGAAMSLCEARIAALRKLIEQTVDSEKLEKYLGQLDLLQSPLGLSPSTLAAATPSLLPSASRSPGGFFSPDLVRASSQATSETELTEPRDLTRDLEKSLRTQLSQIDALKLKSSDEDQVTKLLPYLNQLDQLIRRDFEIITTDPEQDQKNIAQFFQQMGQLESVVMTAFNRHVIEGEDLGETVHSVVLRRVSQENLSRFLQISAKIFAEFYSSCHALKIKKLESDPDQAFILSGWAEKHCQKVFLCAEALKKQGHGAQYVIEFSCWFMDFQKTQSGHVARREPVLGSPDASPYRAPVLSRPAFSFACAARALGVGGSTAGASDDRSDLQSQDSFPAVGTQ